MVVSVVKANIHSTPGLDSPVNRTPALNSLSTSARLLGVQNFASDLTSRSRKWTCDNTHVYVYSLEVNKEMPVHNHHDNKLSENIVTFSCMY